MFDWLGLIGSAHKAADLDVMVASDGDLLDAARQLARVRGLVEVAEARVVHRLDLLGTTDVESGLGTVGWLARETRCSRPTARRRVGLAAGLAALPDTESRLADGTISVDHARVLSRAVSNLRVRGDIVAMETELLDLADGAVFEVWRRSVETGVELLDEDGPDPDGDARNGLRIGVTGTDTHLSGTLVGDVAESVRQAIETVADELFRRYSRDRDTCPELKIPSRATLRALALAEICDRARGKQAGRASVADITLVVDADDPEAGPVTGPDGVLLQDGSVRTLCCDAAWHPVVVDSLGVPLDMGREIRHPNRAQRRALHHRDGGCAFPGCDAIVAWTDAHHIEWWLRDHGSTAVGDMICLCRHHHRVVHRPGWHIHTTGDGWHTITTPAGHTMWTQRHHRRRTGAAPRPPRPPGAPPGGGPDPP